jgi:tetratricopeptide (TPR) repeat protein
MTKMYRNIITHSILAAGLTGCSASHNADDSLDPVLNGTIQYPFVDETKPLGLNTPEQKFVIRSAVGNKEYSIEIPGEAHDYDVQVPLADLGAGDSFDPLGGPKPKDLANPTATDAEIIANLPRIERERPTDAAMMDAAFGVGNSEGPAQAPSYTLGMAKINTYYKSRQYEYALIELNSLIAFYPNSPKLHKMKGTVLLKMRNLPLAELAWIKALELEPKDRGLRQALAKLQQRIVAIGKSPQSMPLDQAMPIPAPVGTMPPTKEGALSQ